MKKKVLIGMAALLIGGATYNVVAEVNATGKIYNCEGGSSCKKGYSSKTNIWGTIKCCCCNANGNTGTYHGPKVRIDVDLD